MSADKIATYAVLLVLTTIAPFWSLLLFALLSPWNALNDLIGWDPRLGWSFMLALRGCWQGWNTRPYRFPLVAAWAFWAFVLLASVELVCETEKVPTGELGGAVFLFLYFLAGAFATYAIVKLVTNSRKAQMLVIMLASSLVCASVFGLIQACISYFKGDTSARIPGTLGNPNYFAAYLSIGATIVILFVRLKMLSRTIGILACLIAGITCLLTLSRMGVVACLIGITTASLIRHTGRLLNLRIVVTILAISFIGVGLALGYLWEVRRSLTFSSDPSQAEIASMAQRMEDLSRLEAVAFALSSWERNPIFGVGINTIAARNYKAEGMYVTTHDTYVQVLAGTGLVGFLLFGIALGSIIRSLRAEVRRFLLQPLVVLCVCSFFGDYLQSIDIFVMFAVLFAVLHNKNSETVRAL